MPHQKKNSWLIMVMSVASGLETIVQNTSKASGCRYCPTGGETQAGAGVYLPDCSCTDTHAALRYSKTGRVKAGR